MPAIVDSVTRDDLIAVLGELPVGLALFRPRYAPDGGIEDLVVVYANAVLLGMVDVPDLVGRGLAESIPENRPTGLLDRYIGVYETGVPYHEELVAFEAEAARGVFEVHARRVGELLMIQVVDVTARVEAERIEAAARRREAETLERINDAVVGIDREWRFTFANAQASRLLGWDPEDLVGRDMWETFPDVAGSEFERQFRHAVAYDEKVTFEAYYPEPLDTWFLVSAYPGPDGLTVFFQDVGARRRVEARAADLQRLESNALLAGSMAHDFNNLLMVISGHATLLAHSIGADHPGHADLDAIRRATDRATALTRELVDFSRSQAPRPSLVDLNGFVEGLGPLLVRAVPASVRVELRPAVEPVLVEVDRAGLQRALLHLADNAGQAMADGGALVVEVSVAQVGPADALEHPDRAPGWYGVVTVADTGVGMPETVRRRAVEPFFSTKRSAGASGLGLAAVDGLVRQAGGHLVIDSEPGAGTTVRLHLPRAHPTDG